MIYKAHIQISLVVKTANKTAFFNFNFCSMDKNWTRCCQIIELEYIVSIMSCKSIYHTNLSFRLIFVVL